MATEQRPVIGVRRAASGDLETLVEFNAAMAWETEEKALDLARLRAGVAAALRVEEVALTHAAGESRDDAKHHDQRALHLRSREAA